MKRLFLFIYCVLFGSPLLLSNISTVFSQNITSNLLTRDTILINSLINEGKSKLDSSQLDSARLFFLRAIEIQEYFISESTDTSAINEWWKCHGLVSSTYSGKQLYSKAIDYLKPKISEASFPKNKFICSELAECNVLVAENYFNQGEMNSSIEYFKSALGIYKKLNNLKKISALEYSIGRTYFYTGLRDSTSKYTNLSLV